MKLKQIKTIKGYKSFQNFSWQPFLNNEIFHDKVNIFYGENGSGKSSICNVLKNVLPGGGITEAISDNNHGYKSFGKVRPESVSLQFGDGEYIFKHLIPEEADEIAVSQYVARGFSDNFWDKKLSASNSILFFDRDFVAKNVHEYERKTTKGGQEQESGKLIIEFDSKAIELRNIKSKAKELKDEHIQVIVKLTNSNMEVMSFELSSDDKILFSKYSDFSEAEIKDAIDKLVEEQNALSISLKDDKHAFDKVVKIQNEIRLLTAIDEDLTLAEYEKYQGLFDFDLKESTQVEAKQTLVEKIAKHKAFFESGIALRELHKGECPFCQSKTEEDNINLIVDLYNQIFDAAYTYETVENVTIGTSTPVETYTYDALGNILTKTDQGTYEYEGNQGSAYANPHAVTSIGSTTYQYDNNGNLLTISDSTTYTYNHHNRLTESEVGSSTVTYAYDYTGRRVKKTGTETTLYPFSDYEVTGTDKRIHLYADNMLIATVDVSTSSTNLVYNHTDHQGSSRLVTGENAEIIQNTTYQPFGAERSNSGSYDQKRLYTGHDYDGETELTYAGARYLNTNIGKWISLDPASRDNPNQFLRDPQQLNSYSYARNNPIIFIDPDGEKVELVARPVISSHDAHMFYLVTPDNPSEISINGVPQGTEKFTIGAYNRGGFMGIGNKLTPEFGYGGMENPNTDTPYLTGEKSPTASVVVTPPDGMSDTDFINSLGASANGVGKTAYYMLGQTGKFGVANSNNFVYEVGNRSGIGNQVSSFNSSGVYIPGKSQGVPTTTLLGNIKSTLINIKEQLSKKDDK